MTDSQLTTEADVIKNETIVGANTAQRVGQMLDDIIANKINNDKIDTDVTLAADSDSLVASQKATKTYIDTKNALLPKVYKGYFNQSGTSIPVVTVVKSDLSGAIVWTRNSIGNYTGTLAAAFTSGKTFIGSKSETNVENNRELTMFYVDANNINVYCRKTTDSTLVDLNLTNDSFNIEIEVYP